MSSTRDRFFHECSGWRTHSPRGTVCYTFVEEPRYIELHPRGPPQGDAYVLQAQSLKQRNSATILVRTALLMRWPAWVQRRGQCDSNCYFCHGTKTVGAFSESLCESASGQTYVDSHRTMKPAKTSFSTCLHLIRRVPSVLILTLIGAIK